MDKFLPTRAQIASLSEGDYFRDLLGLPRLYELDEVAGVFEDAGFSVSVANLKLGFVPVSAHRHGHDDRGDLLAWLDYYSREKVLFRFIRPA
jgi:hypothetical protein